MPIDAQDMIAFAIEENGRLSADLKNARVVLSAYDQLVDDLRAEIAALNPSATTEAAPSTPPSTDRS